MYAIDRSGNAIWLPGNHIELQTAYDFDDYEARVVVVTDEMHEGFPASYALHEGTRDECTEYRDWLIQQVSQVQPVFGRPDIASTPKPPQPEPEPGPVESEPVADPIPF